ncbi:MAG: plasmid pRiA4b ORF-3 family protein [Clostridiales bacterium]|nr:plasmid pRiA4b ORF-3 family protein [Clostridiales bacterium]
MKSYIINIVLEDSDPIIWRKVILPAGATYKRLHDIIQNVTNFQSGYPCGGYHLYDFDLSKDNVRVTDNDDAYLNHKHYMKNKKMYEERLKTVPKGVLDFEIRHQSHLEKVVKKPSGLKIDAYLETYKEIEYLYDFGDGWTFKITLEDIVDDYYFGYATLLSGAETAPPEDVGGIYGYYSFLEIYNDSTHPEHESMKTWAESQRYKEFDIQRINDYLKSIKYRKTEWDKINHVRYVIIEDKYHKN